MKYYRMSYEEVVNERSYSNIMLLNAAIPGTKPKEEREEKAKELGVTVVPIIAKKKNGVDLLKERSTPFLLGKTTICGNHWK